MGSTDTPERSTALIEPPAQLSRRRGRPQPARIRFLTDRYDWMGPAIVVLSSWYFAAQVLVAWTFRPEYSFVTNAISDLGNTGCPPPGSNICSPRYVVMDASIAILVGSVPENVNTAHLHTVGTAMVIGFGQLAILILGLVLREIDDWLREFMLVTSLFVLLAGICISFNHPFGIGWGALERLAQYPESVWLILFGFYISRDHYRNGLTGRHFEFAKAETRPVKGATLGWALRASAKSVRGAAQPPQQKLAGE